MVQRFDVLVIDLDGTLLARDGTVSDRNVEALHRAAEAGVTVIVATGRALAEASRSIECVHHHGMVIVAGGALLCDADTGRTIFREPMHEPVVSETAQMMFDDGHAVLLLKDRHATGYDYLILGEGRLDPASRWWFSHMPVESRYAESVIQDGHPDDTVRVAVVAEGNRVAPLASRLRERLGHRASLQHWPAVTSTHAVKSPTHFLEVFRPDVNKWTMIKQFCARHDIDTRRVAAIGDGLNDLQMIEQAGIGVAMGNADPRIAAVADYHTTDHEADGVAEAIDALLENRW